MARPRDDDTIDDDTLGESGPDSFLRAVAAPPAAAHARRFRPGDRLGRYEVSGVLGRGGLGTVYEAWDPQLQRHVAIKVPHRDAHGGDLALKEARAVAVLRHPGIVPLYGVEEHEGRPFLVMELVRGTTLGADLRAPLAPERALALAIEVGEAVAAAHRAGVIHRDIKPSNVLVDEDGRLRLVDFGLARRADVQQSITFSGTGAGTPSYMAPEQRTGATVGPWTDVWALGALLYAMLTGGPPKASADPLAPFDAGSDAALGRALAESPRATALRAALDRLLATHPDRRPRDADAAVVLLREVAAPAPVVPAPVEAASPSGSPPASPWRPSRSVSLLAGLTVAAALAAVLALVITSPSSRDRAPPVLGEGPLTMRSSDARITSVVVDPDGERVAFLDALGRVSTGRHGEGAEASLTELSEPASAIRFAERALHVVTATRRVLRCDDGCREIGQLAATPDVEHASQAARDPAGRWVYRSDDRLVVDDLRGSAGTLLEPPPGERIIAWALHPRDDLRAVVLESQADLTTRLCTQQRAEPLRCLHEPQLLQLDARTGLALADDALFFVRAAPPPGAPGSTLVRAALTSAGHLGPPEPVARLEGRPVSLLDVSRSGERLVAIRPELNYRSLAGRAEHHEGANSTVVLGPRLGHDVGTRVSSFAASERAVATTGMRGDGRWGSALRAIDGGRVEWFADHGRATVWPVPAPGGGWLALELEVGADGTRARVVLTARETPQAASTELAEVGEAPLVAMGVAPAHVRVRCGPTHCVVGRLSGTTLTWSRLHPAGPRAGLGETLARADGATREDQIRWDVGAEALRFWAAGRFSRVDLGSGAVTADALPHAGPLEPFRLVASQEGTEWYWLLRDLATNRFALAVERGEPGALEILVTRDDALLQYAAARGDDVVVSLAEFTTNAWWLELRGEP